ncbi:hypothetical protein V2I01_00405 [Micromonospora sp. BRA006-A]|nr:hypothetical protein [Micromonospora sp. BRA006-A]
MNRREIPAQRRRGLLATPAAGLLAGCATSGGATRATRARTRAPRSEQNPLGVAEDAPLEVVIFNGGFGEDYAKAHEAMYKERYPKAEIKHSATAEISKTLQPRFVDGSPPDVVNNSGAGQIDFNGLVSQNALADLGVLAAPSLDTPGKTVKDTLLPGTVEVGSPTTAGSWCSTTPTRCTASGTPRSCSPTAAGRTPRPGTTTSRSAAGSRPRASPLDVRRCAPRYMSWPLISTAIKLGGPSVALAIDNLSPTPGSRTR